ncbi:response regulator [Sphingomonas sp. JC676]|uniref:response regulator n=1 Tax=Sphingomonas sp. JC676 TaxID=2768065 RepID=UPI0016583753|nr:response regulator [Sphingomonas sp. JC676]MBC9031400.1 response regulator [Sphingomonas sp. JC676]
MATFLIVDDDQFVSQSVEWLVRDMGHYTLLATDLAGALLHLKNSPAIDALMIDIRLGALASGGYDVADHAISLRPALRVLYMSGTPLTPEMATHFVRGGQFLEKPYSVQRLERSVNELLH